MNYLIFISSFFSSSLFSSISSFCFFYFHCCYYFVHHAKQIVPLFDIFIHLYQNVVLLFTILLSFTIHFLPINTLFCFYDLYIPSLFPIDLFPSFRPFSDLTVFFLLSFSIDTQVYRQTLTHTYIHTHTNNIHNMFISKFHV